MATRYDPSETTRIRRGFEREMLSRFRKLAAAVIELLITEDALGLLPEPPPPDPTQATQNVRGIWRFLQNPEKLEAFQQWLQSQVDEGILSTGTKPPWTSKWVESAYKKGVIRAATETRKRTKKLGSTPPAPPSPTAIAFEDGKASEFLRQAFAQPEQVQKVRLLGTRTYEQLKGVTAGMASKMNRVLADGMAQGDNPRVVARQLAKEVQDLGKGRALTIARTEIIHAHSEGQLDSFEDLGVEEVGVYAEWSTAEDGRVCPQCDALEGKIFTVREARGMIPRHPNCRCTWIPAVDPETRGRKRGLLAALKKSIGKKDGKLKTTSWAGKVLVKKIEKKGVKK